VVYRCTEGLAGSCFNKKHVVSLAIERLALSCFVKKKSVDCLGIEG
jgi:hypothetical protein